MYICSHKTTKTPMIQERNATTSWRCRHKQTSLNQTCQWIVQWRISAQHHEYTQCRHKSVVSIQTYQIKIELKYGETLQLKEHQQCNTSMSYIQWYNANQNREYKPLTPLNKSIMKQHVQITQAVPSDQNSSQDHSWKLTSQYANNKCNQK